MLFHSTVLFERAPSQSLSEEDGMSGERRQQEAAWQKCVWMLRTGETDLRIPRHQLSEESSVVMVGNVFNVFTTWQDAASIQSGWTVPASAKAQGGCCCALVAVAVKRPRPAGGAPPPPIGDPPLSSTLHIFHGRYRESA